MKQPVGVYRLRCGGQAARAHLAELPPERAQLPPVPTTPSVSSLLGVEFLAATGADMTWFAAADRLAVFAELAPVLVTRDQRRWISGHQVETW
jgi:hypothetical protein